MSKKIKLTEEEIGDSNAMSSMISKAKKSSADLKKETADNLLYSKMSKKLKPSIKKLYKDEIISEDKYGKLLQYLTDEKYDKLITALKKFPDYYEEEDSSSSSSSEDEKPKKKMTKKKGQGIMDYLNQF
jgi:hypothetical protein